MKKTFKKKGSSLLMVLVAALLVISLGTMALGMSLSNVRTASKVKKYNKEYYDLERASQIVFSKIDKELVKAENLALGYMEKELYRDDKYISGGSGSPEEISKLKWGSGNHGFFHDRWKAKVLEESYLPGTKNPNPYKYQELLDGYFYEAFNRLYYDYCQGLLRNIGGDLNIDGVNVSLKIKDNPSKDYRTVSDSTKWDNYRLDIGDFNIVVELSNSIGRKIEGKIALTPPEYSSVETTRFKPYRGNPIATNALVAGNNIIFDNSSSTIEGEVTAMTSGDKGIVFSNSDVTVNGNLCSGMNITMDKKSTVKVKEFSPTTELNIKKLIYDDTKFIDVGDGKIVTHYISNPRPFGAEEANPSTYDNIMPFIFNDMQGGNTYCQGLNILENANESEFETRNLMIKSGVNIDSNSKSSVEVKNIYVGTSSDTNNIVKERDYKVIDPAINNYKLTNNELKILRGYFNNEVHNPGKFDEGKSSLQYKQQYLYKSHDGSRPLQNILDARGRNLGSYNRTFGSYIDESKISNASKEESKILFLNGNSTLNLKDKNISDIVYCSGNLTIEGNDNSVFTGVIMCKGNITVKGGCVFKYSEAVVKNVLRDSKLAMEFFAIGEKGKSFSLKKNDTISNVEVKEAKNTRVRKRTAKDRYKVIEWSKKTQ